MTSAIKWLSSLVVLLAAAGCDVDYEADPEPDTGVYVEEREFDVPDVEVRDDPDVEVRDAPDVNVHESPDVNLREGPNVNVEEAPDVEVNESPDVKVEDAPEAEQPAGEEPQS